MEIKMSDQDEIISLLRGFCVGDKVRVTLYPIRNQRADAGWSGNILCDSNDAEHVYWIIDMIDTTEPAYRVYWNGGDSLNDRVYDWVFSDEIAHYYG